MTLLPFAERWQGTSSRSVMNDFAFVGIILGFFVLAVLFVRVCDRIIGPEEESQGVASVGEANVERPAA
jgi:hypothetical protein